jgi:hypothetical protein
MSDFKLKDGTEITFDLSKMSMTEFRALFSPEQPAEVGDGIVGKCCGMTASQLGALSYPEYRALTTAFFRRTKEPQDPNSESAST